jgi:peroxiredoxin Q/BCP
VLGVSHNSVESHNRYAAKLGLGFPLLADPEGTVALAYGAKGWLPFFKRMTVVVDGRGVVRLTMSGMPDVEGLLTFLEGLRGDLA